jgi:NAD(P)-dependent dehydrogenase (short-subunit alcohol dehydrogenase family)
MDRPSEGDHDVKQERPLTGRVALVAGATRGAGRAIAIELPRAGAHVYATGRSSTSAGRSEINRPETIDETGDLIAQAGGRGTALRVDHEDAQAVAQLVSCIETTHGRLDIVVNDIFGGERYAEWDKPLWEHGLRMLRMAADTHLITSVKAIPLLLRSDVGGLIIEMTDGTTEVNAKFRSGVGFYYDLLKANVERIIKGLSFELADLPVTALGVTPGWLRSENMLEQFGVTEDNWRRACETSPGFAISESPTYVARGIAALAGDRRASRFAGQVLTSPRLADTYGVTDTGGSRPDCWSLVDTYGFDHGSLNDIDQYR